MSQRNPLKPKPIDLDSIDLVQRVDSARQASGSTDFIKFGSQSPSFVPVALFGGIVLAIMFALLYSNVRSSWQWTGQLDGTTQQFFWAATAAPDGRATGVASSNATHASVSSSEKATRAAQSQPSGVRSVGLDQVVEANVPSQNANLFFHPELNRLYVFTIQNKSTIKQLDTSAITARLYSGGQTTRSIRIATAEKRELLFMSRSAASNMLFLDPAYGTYGVTMATIEVNYTSARQIETGQTDVHTVTLSSSDFSFVRVYYRLVTNGRPTTLTYQTLSGDAPPEMSLGRIGDDGVFIPVVNSMGNTSDNTQVLTFDPDLSLQAPIIFRLRFPARRHISDAPYHLSYKLETR